jgi:DNA-binding SARP family transcriptional activator
LLHFSLLGAIDLKESPDFLSNTKRVALLAYLAAARPYGSHTRDKVATLFWPELDQTSARDNLRRALHKVRDELGKELILNIGDENISLNRELIVTDIDAMHKAAEAGQYLRALEIYQGELMPGFFADAPGFEQWLEDERESLRQTALGYALKLLEQLEADSNFTIATQWVRKIVKLVQFEERIIRKLMSFLVRAGARADALSIYDGFAKKLQAELGTAPDAETQALAASIRSK